MFLPVLLGLAGSVFLLAKAWGKIRRSRWRWWLTLLDKMKWIREVEEAILALDFNPYDYESMIRWRMMREEKLPGCVNRTPFCGWGDPEFVVDLGEGLQVWIKGQFHTSSYYHDPEYVHLKVDIGFEDEIIFSSHGQWFDDIDMRELWRASYKQALQKKSDQEKALAREAAEKEAEKKANQKQTLRRLKRSNANRSRGLTLAKHQGSPERGLSRLTGNPDAADAISESEGLS